MGKHIPWEQQHPLTAYAQVDRSGKVYAVVTRRVTTPPRSHKTRWWIPCPTDTIGDITKLSWSWTRARWEESPMTNDVRAIHLRG